MQSMKPSPTQMLSRVNVKNFIEKMGIGIIIVIRFNWKRGGTVYMPNVKSMRKAAYDIDPIYIKRWSPRSFTDQAIPDDVLYSLFEAARWAPSAANMQPWRFIIARTPADKENFLSFIDDGNVIWCQNAPVLVAVASRMDNPKSGKENRTHAFDTGTAWGFLALEANRKGLITHAMGGFDREKAKAALRLPKNFAVHAIVAIGYQGDKEALPKHLQEREQPSDRYDISTFVFEGMFKG